MSEDVDPQWAVRVLQPAVIDAAQVDRVESGVPDQLGGDRLGFLVARQEQDPGRLAVVVVGHDARRERVEGAHPARPREHVGQRPQCHLLLPERVGRVEHDAAIQWAGCLQRVRHSGARDGYEYHFGSRYRAGDGGRVCALPKFCRQRPRLGGVPRRERDVVAGSVP